MRLWPICRWMIGAVIVGLLHASYAVADEAKKPDQKLVKLVTGDEPWPPFTDPQAPNGGKLTQVIAEIFQSQNYRVKIDYRPWRRGYDETRNQIYDLTFPYLKTPERELHFAFSKPIFSTISRFWVNRDRRLNLVNEQDFANKVMCLPRGYAVPERFSMMPNLEVQEAADMVSCLKLVVSGRADFIINSETTMIQSLRESGYLGRVIATENEVQRIANHMIMARAHPKRGEIFADFHMGLAKFLENGRLEEILAPEFGVVVGDQPATH